MSDHMRRPKKQAAQPRDKTSKPKLVPYDSNPPPPDFLVKYMNEIPHDPTRPALGHEITVDDIDHVLDRERIDILASSDLFSWRAVDVILEAFIAAFPSANSAEERMTLARKALFGEVRHGRSSDDDRKMLREIAHVVVYDQLIEPPNPRPLAEIIESLFEPKDWSKFKAEEQKAVLTRLRRKFNQHREELVAEVTANIHPAQQERWSKVQQILLLLRELRILPRDGAPGTQTGVH